jgi:hypothetical protein
MQRVLNTVWWATLNAVARSCFPGAWIPIPLPNHATTHGSLMGENFFDAIAKAFDNCCRIFCKWFEYLAIFPTAFILQRLR